MDPAVSGTVEGMACSSDKNGDPHIYLDIGMSSFFICECYALLLFHKIRRYHDTCDT